MASQIDKVLVVGLGKVGSLVGTLLQRAGFEVIGRDARPVEGLSFPSEVLNVSDSAALAIALDGCQGVVSCLPYQFNLPVAEAAVHQGVHYFDLTEDVPTTNAIQEMAGEAKSVLAPQCGLAPGFIGIVGADLARQFDDVRSIELRVGALPEHPRGSMGYSFTWSSAGVINEYLNECEVISMGQRSLVPSLEAVETIHINGLRLEAFTTSGGLGTMCETWDGKLETLNYKTMRYPGHCDRMRFFLHELGMNRNREEAAKILTEACPPVQDDVVYVHAAVEGHQSGSLQREEFVGEYRPIDVNGTEWRAISWTTACSVAAVVEMVRDGSLPEKGFIKQEEIPLEPYLSTKSGSLYLGIDDDDSEE
ncbi:MAG: saccharopine dehydrogenase NADP-binding domain-containing protein [Planctomycetia bacterium]|nr:saccharopine dehydrogenase NADP-binding domain-containing protein [Planctomycetia bacterium]MBL6915683.1 saccharopine dehydrogenase NADP-binding domain-containing protein [Planctomycetota bacterium]MDG2085119.1 saccharopine dehydrogenase C-terminal domain-containing protein [Planctomycetota bacterium]